MNPDSEESTRQGDRPEPASGLDVSLSTGVRVGIALLAVAALVAVAGVWFALAGGPTDHRYVIPQGTAERLNNGEQIEIIPGELFFSAGDTMTVVNNDTADHNVSVTQVPAGQTVTDEFPSPGVFDGACTVHPRGSVRIEVT